VAIPPNQTTISGDLAWCNTHEVQEIAPREGLWYKICCTHKINLNTWSERVKLHVNKNKFVVGNNWQISSLLMMTA
jgi:hypothetical protein